MTRRRCISPKVMRYQPLGGFSMDELMSKRFTDTTKWTDRWFRKLSIEEKLLFLWLIDNCDNAGFWEVDVELAALQIGVSEDAALGAWQGLSRAYVQQGDYVWIRRFIRVQGNCPLNPDNNAHKQILSLFQEHADFGFDFESAICSDPKNSPSLGPKEAPCKGRGRSNGNGNGHGKSKTANFDIFWKAYPKKKSKDAALRRWRAIKPSFELLQIILAAIEQQKKSEQWTKDNGQFIPHPATWLNAGGWKDETSSPVPKRKTASQIRAEYAARGEDI